MGFIEELQWRGLIHNIIPGTEELFKNDSVKIGYAGFDPTADSLHVGNLIPIMLLAHFQRFRNKPLVIVGGATGMVGDPSGKTDERKLLDISVIRYNIEKQKKQLMQFLDFDCGEISAEILNNYDWIGKMKFMDFLKEVGTKASLNTMLSKDSVKNRLKTEMSYTEFVYQLIQAYDFYWLFNNRNCNVQMGGADQWGNIIAGVDLIGRFDNKMSYALTCPLIKKADGTKFGKSEKGNIWLDSEKTNVGDFYDFWLQASDFDAEKYIKIFTFITEEKLNQLLAEHKINPEQKKLQKVLAAMTTELVHGTEKLKELNF